MLGICGNGDVIKSLIILEKSFLLLGEDETDNIPKNILLSKTENGSMEKLLFTDWIKQSVIPHKQVHNPEGTSLLILDNHGSRFCIEAIEFCKENKIEILCYAGHLTHVLQGPDVVLNKPVSTIVDNMIHNNIFITGNSDLTRIAFMASIDHAVKEVCTKEMVKKAFSANGVISFDPSQIDLSASQVNIEVSPMKATRSNCRIQNVQIHPLVKQGVISKRLADVFTYTPPPDKTKSIVQSCKECKSNYIRRSHKGN